MIVILVIYYTAHAMYAVRLDGREEENQRKTDAHSHSPLPRSVCRRRRHVRVTCAREGPVRKPTEMRGVDNEDVTRI